MKNMRNIAAAIVMVTFLAVGTTFAGDGILVGGKSDGILVGGRAQTSGCQTPKSAAGILIADITSVVVEAFTGVAVAGKDGIMISDRSCQAKDGIMISDKDGILVGG